MGSWFPITDPSRADDIRMRRKRAALLLGGVVMLPWIVGNDRHARQVVSPHMHVVTTVDVPDRPHRGELTRSIDAPSLRVDLPCADSVSVVPDPRLPGRAIISVPAGEEDAFEAISVSDGSVTGHGTCADVTIRVGNAVPLELRNTGSSDMRVGRFDSPVMVNNSGSGSVSIDHAGPLTVNASRSGDVTVGSVTGPVEAILGGSGDLRIEGGTVPALQVTSRGSGDLLLGAVSALAGRAELDGSGDLKLGGIGASFEAITNGSGDIFIAQAQSDHLVLRGEGAGNISIGTGHIARLEAVRFGSGDLSIEASIQGGTLQHHGDGTVSILHADALERSD